MSLWKRGKWYSADFTVNGQRYRVPLKTTDEREAKREEKRLISEAGRGKLTASGENFARLAFSEAADRYLAERMPHLAPLSIRTEKERSRPLKEFFGATPLRKIRVESIWEYVAHRKASKKRGPQGRRLEAQASGISNRTINMEVALLRRILKRAKRLHLLTDDLKALPERRGVGRALALDEKLRLIQVAKGNPDWDNARLAMTLALNTTMRGCEIKGLCWRDVNLLDRTLTIRRSETKTDAGERAIPLNSDALATILEMRDRAKGFFGGNLAPDWYVFPHAEGFTKPDPTKPMSGWRSAWRSLRKAAAKGDKEKGIPEMPGLAALRFHDLRHHAITELAESQASDQTIMSIAGHVSRRMLEHYSHVRMEAKRQALDALSSKSKEASRGVLEEGYVTHHVTNQTASALPEPQAIEKIGGDDGTRTRDLMRDRHAF